MAGAALSAGLVAGGLPHLAPLGAIPAAAGLFVLSFYRDPERTPASSDPDVCIAPADGVVTDIGEVDEPHFIQGRALRVGIFLSPLNVHVNRTSLAGTVRFVQHFPGKCLPATGTTCIDENEALLLGLETPGGLQVGLRQVTGALARTIVCQAEVGDALERGQRYGMIKLGSRTELLVPADCGFEAAVSVGDAVRGGQTVLGRIPARVAEAA